MASTPFEYKYICSANVSVVVLSNKVTKSEVIEYSYKNSLDSAAITFTLSTSTQPVYSHQANKFDAVFLGRTIVQGSIVLNYTDIAYFYKSIDPETYANHMIKNFVNKNKNTHSLYLDYNSLRPFYIYIIEGNSSKSDKCQVHCLSNCYITSRGQSIYADDQNVIEEYSFVAQGYELSFSNFRSGSVNATAEEKSEPASQEQLNAQPEKSNKPTTVNITKTQVKSTKKDSDSDTNRLIKELGGATVDDGSEEQPDDQPEADVPKIPTNTTPGTNPVPPTSNNPNTEPKIKISDPKMKDDIRNTNTIIGRDPLLSYRILNNIILPNGDMDVSNFSDDDKKYYDTHINNIRSYLKGEKNLNKFINDLEYEIPNSFYPEKFGPGEGNMPPLIDTANQNYNYIEQNIINRMTDPNKNYIFKNESSSYFSQIKNIFSSNHFEPEEITSNPKSIQNNKDLAKYYNYMGYLNEPSLDLWLKKESLNSTNEIIRSNSGLNLPLWGQQAPIKDFFSAFSNQNDLNAARIYYKKDGSPIFNKGENDSILDFFNFDLNDRPVTHINNPSNSYNQNYNSSVNIDYVYNDHPWPETNTSSSNFFDLAFRKVPSIYGLSPFDDGENSSSKEVLKEVIQVYFDKKDPNKSDLEIALELAKKIYIYTEDGNVRTLYDKWSEDSSRLNSRWKY